MAWEKRAKGEYHSVQSGFGVAAWDTGWCVYWTADTNASASRPMYPAHMYRGIAEGLEEAKANAVAVAKALASFQKIVRSHGGEA
ncbi:MAG: hypothetical protein WC565_03920 [Parcubacteria group bacterium]|jgi:hypothetical protein